MALVATVWRMSSAARSIRPPVTETNLGNFQAQACKTMLRLLSSKTAFEGFRVGLQRAVIKTERSGADFRSTDSGCRIINQQHKASLQMVPIRISVRWLMVASPSFDRCIGRASPCICARVSARAYIHNLPNGAVRLLPTAQTGLQGVSAIAGRIPPSQHDAFC